MLTTFAAGQTPRLDLRLVAQSGVPGPGSCVYDDPPTPPGGLNPPVSAAISPGVARRFEVQYRLMDAASGRALPTLGLRSARLDVRAAVAGAGLWARPLLSSAEGDAVRSADPAARTDCSGLPPAPAFRPRGLHAPFRAALAGADPNEDVDNGAFNPVGLLAIHALAAGPPGHTAARVDEWFGVASIEFVAAAGFAGSLTLTVGLTVGQTGFEWFGPLGAIHTGTLVSTGTMTLTGPAAPGACCTRAFCFIAATPSACFASGGVLAGSGACSTGGAGDCCFADFNRDGALGVQDLLEFLVAYQALNPAADINGSGTLTVQDVFDYLRTYFAGCA